MALTLAAMIAGCLREPSLRPFSTAPGELTVQTGYTPGDYGPLVDAGKYPVFVLQWDPVEGADHYVVKMSPQSITEESWGGLEVARTVPGSEDTCWVSLQPRIYENTCIGCGLCAEACPNNAITMVNGRAVIDADSCTACGQCALVCPTSAVTDNRFNRGYYFAVRAYSDDGTPRRSVATTANAYRMIYKNDSDRCDRCWDLQADTSECYMLCRNPECPVDAIYWDSTYFYQIDYDKCIYCGHCFKNCRRYGVLSMGVWIEEME
jgi:ferredoxin